MKMTYRTKRKIQRIANITTVTVVTVLILWIISAVWLQRYVVYSRDGASVDMSRQISDRPGNPAVKPEAKGGVSIYYNEGSDAIELTSEMQKINGYYISYDDLSKRMDDVWKDLDNVKAGTSVMIELKGGYGTFYYSSKLAEATPSASVDQEQVDALITELKNRGFYVIGKFSAFRDYTFGNSHVSSGLYMLSRAGLWLDAGGCFWMNPTDPTVLNWVISITNEIKNLGFHEVMLADFAFPNSDKYIYNGDKDAALLEAQQVIMEKCQSEYFTVSFGVNNSNFALPEGRSRMYLENVDAQNAENVYNQSQILDPATRLVFVCSTNDTRFDSYSVLRPLSVSEEIEALKAERAKQEKLTNGT